MSLRAVARPDLLAAAQALRAGRLRAPFSDTQLRRVVGRPSPLTAELTRLHALGMAEAQLAELLTLVADERSEGQAIGDRVELVWTGPELQGSTSRSTATVVRELFASATESVLMSTYSLDHPKKIKSLLEPLRERMLSLPEIEVSIFVNIQRKRSDHRPDSILLREFADVFKRAWPGDGRPSVYHDPRALDDTRGPKACLHAKCVIIDRRRAFISSANFSEAAQERNYEAGVVIDDVDLARALGAQFETLARAGTLVRVPGI